MRDHLTSKYIPFCITMLDPDNGAVLWQNGASMAAFGCHGSEASFAWEPSPEAAAAAAAAAGAQAAAATETAGPGPAQAQAEDFLSFLFEQVQGAGAGGLILPADPPPC